MNILLHFVTKDSHNNCIGCVNYNTISNTDMTFASKVKYLIAPKVEGTHTYSQYAACNVNPSFILMMEGVHI